MNRQWFAVVGILAVLAGLIAVGWTVRGRFLPVEVGTVAPDFAARTLEGEEARFAALDGEVVLLNVWATWCPPCREEMPSMQRLYEELGPEGLRIVAVSVDAPVGVLGASGERGGDVAAFATEYGLTFDIWHDPSGRIQQTYRVTGLPESFLIDRDGRIVKKDIGGVMWDTDARMDLVRRLLER